MAEPLQRVFMLFVRPGAIVNTAFTTFTGALELTKEASGTYGDQDYEPPQYSQVIAKHPVNTVTENISNGYHNSNKNYLNDVWMLHSTYTSYENFIIALSSLLNTYPASRILATSYIPTGFIVTPFE